MHRGGGGGSTGGNTEPLAFRRQFGAPAPDAAAEGSNGKAEAVVPSLPPIDASGPPGAGAITGNVGGGGPPRGLGPAQPPPPGAVKHLDAALAQAISKINAAAKAGGRPPR